MRAIAHFIGLCWLIVNLVSCASNPPAPVIDRTPAKPSKPEPSKPDVDKPELVTTPKNTNPSNKPSDWRPDTYTVKKGDNLLKISLELGYYYKDIAQANNIAAPYHIKIGQVLSLKSLKEKNITESQANAAGTQATNSDDVVITPINSETATIATSASPVSVVAIAEPKATREVYSDEALKQTLPSAKPVIINTEAIKPNTPPAATATPSNNSVITPESKPAAELPDDMAWAWPTKGKVVANFNEASNKGLDIAGSLGQTITAAAPGKVIYSGSDLRGYGKLVIIKHNSNYLSVYAHNSLIVVKEGQSIERGQKIAEMGDSDSNSVKLHFEIRRQGKSVDPSKYLVAN